VSRAVLVEALDVLIAEVPRAVEMATQEERVAVVAWLRGQLCVPGLSPDEKRLLGWLSRHIERGEHRREETK
jgi:hypothetical protein